MKKLLTALFLFCASMNFAQITLEHTYNVQTGWAQTGPSTWNYYTADASNINIYNITHALIISKPTPVITGFAFSNISYVSNSLFNLSGNWAWILSYFQTTAPYEDILTIYDETGTQLLRVDSVYILNGGFTFSNPGASIFNSSSGTKILVNLRSPTRNTFYGAKVYSLGGTYYSSVDDVGNGNNLNEFKLPYPNPSNNTIHLTYTLPSGTDKAEMVITNISGQVIKTCNVGSAFNDILLDTKLYAPGEYIYYIHTDNYTSPASKFIISH